MGNLLPQKGSLDLNWYLAATAAVAVALIPAVLFPGDAPWFWDEPQEISIALAANARHWPAFMGLGGSFVPYGAFGIHIMQFFLLFTHNPMALVVLHALASTVPTAIALLWLSRTLKLNSWFVPAILATPYLWFEARRMWQPSFCIPLGAMALAAHASFLRTGSRRSLLIAIGCAIAPLLVHLQALPLSIPILAHLLWHHRPALKRAAAGIAALLAAFAVFHAPYIVWVFILIVFRAGSFVKTGHNSNTPLAEAWWGPFVAGQLFSGSDWGAKTPRAPHWCVTLANLGMPLVWAGMALALWRTATRAFRPVSPLLDSPFPRFPASLSSIRDTLTRLCLAGVLFHIALCAVLRLGTVHHYFFGTFALYAFLAWLAIDFLGRFRLGTLTTALYGLSAATLTAFAIAQAHEIGWPRWLSPTIGEQIALVRQLDQYSDTTAWTEVEVYKARPFVLTVLRSLLPRDPHQPRKFSGHLVIRYASPDSQRIELVESANPPQNAVRIGVADH